MACVMKIQQQLMDFGFSKNMHKKIYLAFASILKVAEFFLDRKSLLCPVADPLFGGGGGLVLFYLPCRLSSFSHFFFFHPK